MSVNSVSVVYFSPTNTTRKAVQAIAEGSGLALKQEINATIQSDEYQDYLDTAGLGRIRYYSEEELTEFLKGAYKAYGDVLAELDMAK